MFFFFFEEDFRQFLSHINAKITRITTDFRGKIFFPELLYMYMLIILVIKPFYFQLLTVVHFVSYTWYDDQTLMLQRFFHKNVKSRNKQIYIFVILNVEYFKQLCAAQISFNIRFNIFHIYTRKLPKNDVLIDEKHITV